MSNVCILFLLFEQKVCWFGREEFFGVFFFSVLQTDLTILEKFWDRTGSVYPKVCFEDVCYDLTIE